MGFGRGQRGGRQGWRHQFHATGLPFWARNEESDIAPLRPAPTRADEVQALKNQASYLEQTLQQLRQRIADLETVPGEES